VFSVGCAFTVRQTHFNMLFLRGWVRVCSKSIAVVLIANDAVSRNSQLPLVVLNRILFTEQPGTRAIQSHGLIQSQQEIVDRPGFVRHIPVEVLGLVTCR
jgi:hypothetical protein